MFNHLRNRLPEAGQVGEVAADRMMKAADSTAKSAKEFAGHLEEWTKEGVGSVKTHPITWGAASLGIGALMGGIYALWRQTAKPDGQASHRTMAARARPKAARHSATSAPKKKARKARRARPTANA